MTIFQSQEMPAKTWYKLNNKIIGENIATI